MLSTRAVTRVAILTVPADQNIIANIEQRFAYCRLSKVLSKVLEVAAGACHQRPMAGQATNPNAEKSIAQLHLPLNL